jgi:hypothetical protein
MLVPIELNKIDRVNKQRRKATVSGNISNDISGKREKQTGALN